MGIKPGASGCASLIIIVWFRFQGSYMTIHITPETNFSYVSFETNVPQQSYHDLITRVLETFQPGKFVLTVFANKVSILSVFLGGYYNAVQY